MWFLELNEKIRYSLGKRDKIVIVNLFIGSILNILLWIGLAVSVFGKSEYVILDYNIYFGISALGPWYNVFVLPLLGFLVIVINFFLSLFLHGNYRVLSYLSAFTISAFNVIIFIGGLILIYNNF